MVVARGALFLLAWLALVGVVPSWGHDHGASHHAVSVPEATNEDTLRQGVALVFALLLPLGAVLAHRGRRYLPLLLGLFLLGHVPLPQASDHHEGPSACCTLAKSTEPPPPLLLPFPSLLLTLDPPVPGQPGWKPTFTVLTIRAPPTATGST